MFYNFKNAKVSVNGRDLICQSVSLSHSSSIESFYDETNKNNNDYVVTNGQRGTFRLVYQLTGEDFLRDYINSETSFSGNLGGLYFQSGYLESYSFQGEANNPVTISLNGVFFDKIKGTFSPTYENIDKNVNYYNFADCSFSVLGSEIGSLSETESFSYSVSNEITPFYNLNSTVPDRVYFGKRSLSMEVVSSNLISNLGLTGQQGGASITFSHPDGGSLSQYSINGRMNSKVYNLSVDGLLKSQISVVSENYAESPTITSFSPTPSSLTVGYNFLINGTNLSNATRVRIADRDISNFTVLSDSQLSGTIPNDAITGNLTVYTYGGSFTTGFPFTDLGITVSSVSPSSGVYGQGFTISGNGFYRISNVQLSQAGATAECDYEVVDNNTILATVPNNYGGYNLTTAVYSSGNGRGIQLDDLTNSFNILPTIRSFTASGLPDDPFIVRTYGHKGFDKIVFNNGPSYDTAASSGYDYLTGLVPEGNTYGKIRIYNTTANVYVESTETFLPTVNPTGVSPTSGRQGDLVSLTGQNFNTGLLYQTIANHYLVDYNGVTGEMKWLSNSGLSGLVPAMTNSGPIRLYSNDGSTLYQNSVYFDYIPPAINVTGIVPESGHSYETNRVKLEGSNLTYVNSIQLLKLDEPNSGDYYSILTGSGTGIGVGLLGNTATFYISGGYYMPTGNYRVIASDAYSSDNDEYYIHNDNSITGYLQILAFNSQTSQYESFDGDSLGISSGLGIKVSSSDFFNVSTSSNGTGWQTLSGISANGLNVSNDSIYEIEIRKNTGDMVSKTIKPFDYYSIRGISNLNEVEVRRKDQSSSVLSFVWEWEKNGFI